MEINEDKMVITDSEGKEHLAHILFTYHHDERDKDYVVFYEDGNEDEAIAMIYTKDHELIEITDEEELDEIEEVFNAFQEDEEEESENN